MNIESGWCASAKAGHDSGLHELEVGARGPVLPNSSNPGMTGAVKRTAEVAAHRVTVAKTHGSQMLRKPVVQAAVRLACVHLSAQGTGENVHQVLSLAVKVCPDHK